MKRSLTAPPVGPATYSRLMVVFESELFEVFGIGTLVWGLALVVLLVRAFSRIRARAARYERRKSPERTGPVSPTSSPPAVGHRPDPYGVGRHDPRLEPDGGGRGSDGPAGVHRRGYGRDGSGDRRVDAGGGGLNRPGGPSPSREEWDSRGFSQYGVHRRTRTLFGPDGFDIHGYDREGYDRQGYDFQGYNRRGSRRRD